MPFVQLRVLMGRNGAGKSTILDAIQLLTDNFSASSKREEQIDGYRIFETDDELSQDPLVTVSRTGRHWKTKDFRNLLRRSDILDPDLEAQKKSLETFPYTSTSTQFKSESTYHLLNALLGPTIRKKIGKDPQAFWKELNPYDESLDRSLCLDLAVMSEIYERYKILFSCYDMESLAEIVRDNSEDLSRFFLELTADNSFRTWFGENERHRSKDREKIFDTWESFRDSKPSFWLKDLDTEILRTVKETGPIPELSGDWANGIAQARVQYKQEKQKRFNLAKARQLTREIAKDLLPILETCRRFAVRNDYNAVEPFVSYAGLVLTREEIPEEIGESLTELFKTHLDIRRPTMPSDLTDLEVEEWQRLEPLFSAETAGYFFQHFAEYHVDEYPDGPEGPEYWREDVNTYFPGWSPRQLTPLLYTALDWVKESPFIKVEFCPGDYGDYSDYQTSKEYEVVRVHTEKRFVFEGGDPDEFDTENMIPIFGDLDEEDEFSSHFSNGTGFSLWKLALPRTRNVTADIDVGDLERYVEDNLGKLHDSLWRDLDHERNAYLSNVWKSIKIYSELIEEIPKVFGNKLPVTKTNGGWTQGLSLGGDGKNWLRESETWLYDSYCFSSGSTQGSVTRNNFDENSRNTAYIVQPTIQPVVSLLEKTANELSPTFLLQAGLISIQINKPGQWIDGKKISITFGGKPLDELPSGWSRWIGVSVHVAFQNLMSSIFALEALPTQSEGLEQLMSQRTKKLSEKFLSAWEKMHAIAHVLEDPEGYRKISVTPMGSHSTILAVDEPEAHLHVDALNDIRGWLKDELRGTKTSAIISTHSPTFMNYSDEDATVTALEVLMDGSIDAYEMNGKPWLDWITDHGEGLGIETVDAMNWYQGFLLVEGTHDEKIIKHFYGSQLDTLQIGVIPMWGSKHTLTETRFMRYHKKPMAVLLDNITNSDSKKLTPEQRQLGDLQKEFKKTGTPFYTTGHELFDIGVTLPEAAVRKYLKKQKITGTFEQGWSPIHKKVRDLIAENPWTPGTEKKKLVCKELGLNEPKYKKYGYSAPNFITPVLNLCEPTDRPDKSLERAMKEIFAFFSDQSTANYL